MEKRVHKGYVQFRDELPRAPWKFVVTAFDSTFTGCRGECVVMRADGGSERVSIDERDRILIAGRRYTRRNWMH